MTITAVHTKIAGVEFMVECNRLDRSISDISITWRAIIPKEAYYHKQRQKCHSHEGCGEIVNPFGKYLRQT